MLEQKQKTYPESTVHALISGVVFNHVAHAVKAILADNCPHETTQILLNDIFRDDLDEVVTRVFENDHYYGATIGPLVKDIARNSTTYATQAIISGGRGDLFPELLARLYHRQQFMDVAQFLGDHPKLYEYISVMRQFLDGEIQSSAFHRLSELENGETFATSVVERGMVGAIGADNVKGFKIFLDWMKSDPRVDQKLVLGHACQMAGCERHRAEIVFGIHNALYELPERNDPSNVGQQPAPVPA